MKTRIALFFILISLVSLSCKAFSAISEEAQPGDVLFQDDFSDSYSGWDQVNSEEGITDYSQGAYRMGINRTNSDIWANPGLTFTDVRLEVDATKMAGDDNNDFGLICRYQDNENFYFFVISSDGYYGIGKIKAGQQSLIGEESMPPTERVNQGEAANHLRGDCVGDTLTLYVNGEKVAEQTDADFASGDVGLIAGAFDIPGTDILFDNFTVLKP